MEIIETALKRGDEPNKSDAFTINGQPGDLYNCYNLTDGVVTPSTGTKVRVLKFNSSVEIVFQGTNVLMAAENHPMHLHGYSFYRVGSGFGNFDNETDPKGYNLIDPPEINTVGVPKNGWAAIRFRADNPGNFSYFGFMSFLFFSFLFFFFFIFYQPRK